MPVPPDMRALYRALEALTQDKSGLDMLRYCAYEVAMAWCQLKAQESDHQARCWTFEEWSRPELKR